MKNTSTLILLIILALHSLNSYSQDYSIYFKSVALAETNLLDSNYNKAIKIYKNTFSKYEFIFPKDAYISAQIASYVGDDSSCFYFLNNGVKNGLPMESVLNNPHLSKWITKQKLKNSAMHLANSLVTIKYNNTYRDTIISMAKEDQRLRDKNETILNSAIFNHKLKPKLYKKWMNQAEIQTEKILEFTTQFGFPSHKIIGTHRKTDYDKFGTNFSSTYAFIILAHYDFAFQTFEEVLPEQLKMGNITPKQVALLRDFATRNYMYGEVKDTTFRDYKYFIRWIDNNKERIKNKNIETEIENRKNYIKENITKIDDDRKKIGLIPYAYQLKMQKNQSLFNKNREILKIEYFPYFDYNYSGWD